MTNNKNQKIQLLISQSTQFRSPMIQKPAASSYCWVSPPVVCPPPSLPAAHSSTLSHGCTPTCRHWYSVSLSYSYHHHGHLNCDLLLPVSCIAIPHHHQICTTAIHNIHIWLYIIQLWTTYIQYELLKKQTEFWLQEYKNFRCYTHCKATCALFFSIHDGLHLYNESISWETLGIGQGYN